MFWVKQLTSALPGKNAVSALLIKSKYYVLLWLTSEIMSSKSCGCHVVYRWCPYAVHVITIWCTCDTHVLYIWYPFDIHMIPMYCACDSHVECVWYPCAVHMIPILCVCDIHVKCIWEQNRWILILLAETAFWPLRADLFLCIMWFNKKIKKKMKVFDQSTGLEK